jgi:hypothetical protein
MRTCRSLFTNKTGAARECTIHPYSTISPSKTRHHSPKWRGRGQKSDTRVSHTLDTSVHHGYHFHSSYRCEHWSMSSRITLMIAYLVNSSWEPPASTAALLSTALHGTMAWGVPRHPQTKTAHRWRTALFFGVDTMMNTNHKEWSKWRGTQVKRIDEDMKPHRKHPHEGSSQHLPIWQEGKKGKERNRQTLNSHELKCIRNKQNQRPNKILNN